MVQKSVNELVAPLAGTDIYAGKLLPGGHVINYIGASKDSCMVGKRLKRGKVRMTHLFFYEVYICVALILTFEMTRFARRSPQGVSFQAIDTGKMVMVRNEAAALAMRAQFFIDRRTQGWPFICLPMKRGKLVRGVICVDSFDGTGIGRADEEHPEKGVPEFVATAGELIGTAMDIKMKREALIKLESVTKDASCTVEDVFTVALECLRVNVAFAQEVNILEITGGYPLPFGKFAGQSTIDLTGAQGGSILLNIIEAKNLAKADLIGASDPFCEVEFNGNIVGTTKARENTLNPFWTNELFELYFVPGMKNSIVIRVFDEDDGQKSEFLGMVEYSSATMEDYGKFKHGVKVMKELGPDPALSREKNKLVQGKLHVCFLTAPEEEESDDEDEIEEAHSNEKVRVI
jgi:hypothetical protein